MRFANEYGGSDANAALGGRRGLRRGFGKKFSELHVQGRGFLQRRAQRWLRMASLWGEVLHSVQRWPERRGQLGGRRRRLRYFRWFAGRIRKMGAGSRNLMKHRARYRKTCHDFG